MKRRSRKRDTRSLVLPDDMDAASAISFLRFLVKKPHDWIAEEARTIIYELADRALQDLQPAELPTWYPIWKAMSEEEQNRVTQLVAQIVAEHRPPGTKH